MFTVHTVCPSAFCRLPLALSPLHISPSPFIAFYGGDFVKATNFIVTERRLSTEQFPDLSLIRRAVTYGLEMHYTDGFKPIFQNHNTITRNTFYRKSVSRVFCR